MGVVAKQLRNGLSESSGPHTVHNPDLIHLGEKGVVEELVHHIHGFVHFSANQIDLVFLEVL